MRALLMVLVGLALVACTGQLSDDPSQQTSLSPFRCSGSTCIRFCRGRHKNRNCVPLPAPADGGVVDDAGPTPSPTPADAGPVIAHDAGSPPSSPPDSGPAPEPGPVDAGAPPPPPPPPSECVGAQRLWFDDFETGDYSRWTNHTYDNGWGNSCESTAISTENPHSGSYSNRSEIVCPSSTDVHRGYGGVQFDHDTPLGSYTNSGVGTQAPGGMVNTFWLWLDTPYGFGGGRWLSLFTAEGACNWSEEVVTVSLEDSTRRLVPAHTSGVTYSPGAPAFPLRQWVRVTIYINYYDGEMHIWQDGTSVVHARFSRSTKAICQWHWGAYSSGDNDDIVLFEDDKSLWKLDSPWTDWSTEPWLEGGSVGPCP